MRSDFVEYLNSLGMTEPLHERVKTIYEFFKRQCPDEITGIFISEYVKEDGSREYESLCFFSEKSFMDAEQFVTKDDFRITPIKGRLYYLNVQKTEYDFKKATEKSRLTIIFHVEIGMGVVVTLKASRENCDYLKDIVLKYVEPNLKE